MWGVVSTHQQAVLLYQMGVLLFSSVLPLSAGDSISSHRFKGSVLQDHPSSYPHPHFRRQLQGQIVTCDSDWLAVDWSFQWPHHWLTDLRETFYLLDDWFIIKGYNSGSARWKRCVGQGVWEGAWSFSAHFEWTTVPTTPRVRQPGRSPNRVLLDFTEASLHRHDWLNHWPLVIELHLQPLSLPWGGVAGMGLKVPTL